MNRFLHHAAFALGLAAVAWVAAGYGLAHPLALALLLPLLAAYLAGAWELHRFRQATSGLLHTVAATAEAPSALGPWLLQLPAGLQGPVRQRVDGERVALPGLALTPYLTGLLVLLGMLGTFLGMVATLQGTGLALENAADVDAIRASLAAPVKGLGLAFGTSVAGVAASAMLGLMSALSRRDRQRAVQRLDACIAGPLRGLSRPHRQAEERDHHQAELLRLQRLQADALGQALPGLVTHIQALTQALGERLDRQGQALATQADQQGRLLAEQFDRHGRLLAEQLLRQGQAQNDALQAAQVRFHAEAQAAYTGLAASVDRSLKDSLTESARLAGAAIQPAVQATLDGLARDAASLRDTLGQTVRQQVDAVGERLDRTADALAQGWRAAMDHQQQHTQQASLALATTVAGFEQHAAALLRSVADAQAAQQQAWADAHAAQQAAVLTAQTAQQASWADAKAQQQAAWEEAQRHQKGTWADAQAKLDAAASARDAAREAAFRDGLLAVTATLQHQGQQHAQAMAERQQQICSTLERTAQAITAQAETQARATIAEIGRLVQTASEAPRAAAQVIGELRSALSDSLVRDNAVLDERNRLMATLGGLLDAVNHASTEQRSAIDALVRSTTDVLQRVGERFADTVDSEARTLQAVAAQVTGSAAEVASLGEGFGVAVQRFSSASEQLAAQLQRIEAALGQSMARSDEQLAYYVAQAREIIDLTLGSQKQIVDDLQKLSRAANAPAAPEEAQPA